MDYSYKKINFILNILITLSAILTIIYFGIIIFGDNSTDSNKKITATKTEYFNYLSKGITNSIFNEEFCRTAFNHFDRLSDGQLSKYGFENTLEDFAIFISLNDSSKNIIDTTNYNKAITLLRSIKSIEPFASLPEEEKRLMDNIQLFIEKSDKANISNSLNQLKQVILQRHTAYEKIEYQNSWAIPLAFAGIFLTLVFGIMGIRQSIKK